MLHCYVPVLRAGVNGVVSGEVSQSRNLLADCRTPCVLVEVSAQFSSRWSKMYCIVLCPESSPLEIWWCQQNCVNKHILRNMFSCCINCWEYTYIFILYVHAVHIPVVGALTLTSVFALRGYLRCIVLQVVPGRLFKAVLGMDRLLVLFQKGVQPCLPPKTSNYLLFLFILFKRNMLTKRIYIEVFERQFRLMQLMHPTKRLLQVPQQKQHPRPQLDQTIGLWELCQDRRCMGGQQIGKETFDEGHHWGEGLGRHWCRSLNHAVWLVSGASSKKGHGFWMIQFYMILFGFFWDPMCF